MDRVADPVKTDADVQSKNGRDLNEPDERHGLDVEPLEPIQRRLVPAELCRHGPLTEIGGLPLVTQLSDDCSD